MLYIVATYSTSRAALEFLGVSSPLQSHLKAWEELLHRNPDTRFVDYTLQGLTEGFRVGFDWSLPLVSSARNIPSAYDHPREIEEYITKEIAANNFIGPLTFRSLSNGQTLQINQIGVVPKGHNSGKWRIITDLSFPPGRSGNDGIAGVKCPLEYTTVIKVAGAAIALGRGALLAKSDIKSAY